MGQRWDAIPEGMQKFIRRQHMFFVATAPSGSDGHVNLSPKGYGNTFALLNSKQVAYLDLGGSGVETFSHVVQNGRITFMFINMESGPPCILRLWGRAVAHERGTPEFDHWVQTAFKAAVQQLQILKSMRSIIVADIYECARACGYAVPIYEYKQDRAVYFEYTDKTAYEKQLECRQANTHSLDGLPGLQIPDPSVYLQLPATTAAPSSSSKAAGAGSGKPVISVTAGSSATDLSQAAAGVELAQVKVPGCLKAADSLPCSKPHCIKVLQPYLSHMLVVLLTLLISNLASAVQVGTNA